MRSSHDVAKTSTYCFTETSTKLVCQLGSPSPYSVLLYPNVPQETQVPGIQSDPTGTATQASGGSTTPCLPIAPLLIHIPRLNYESPLSKRPPPVSGAVFDSGIDHWRTCWARFWTGAGWAASVDIVWWTAHHLLRWKDSFWCLNVVNLIWVANFFLDKNRQLLHNCFIDHCWSNPEKSVHFDRIKHGLNYVR